MLPAPAPARGRRWNEVEYPLGQRQFSRVDRLEQSVERVELHRRRQQGRRRLAVSPHGVAVVDAADDLRRRLDLVAVQQVERRQHILQLRHGRADADAPLGEPLERGPPNGQEAAQFLRRGTAVVPEVSQGMGAAHRPRVLVADVVEAGVDRPLQDGVELRRLVGAVRELGVAVENRPLVPFADADVVGGTQVDRAVLAQGGQGMRIVHDGLAAIRSIDAGGEVVRQADRVADFVGRKLA